MKINWKKTAVIIGVILVFPIVMQLFRYWTGFGSLNCGGFDPITKVMWDGFCLRPWLEDNMMKLGLVLFIIILVIVKSFWKPKKK